MDPAAAAAAGDRMAPHAVCIPYPLQGHINAMLQLARLLHSRGFHVTFVHTEYNYNRILLTSGGPLALEASAGFRFETFRDGLQTPDATTAPSSESLVHAVRNSWSRPVSELVRRLNRGASSARAPPVTCIISDVIMSFGVGVAEEFGVPGVLFCSFSACGYMSSLQVEQLIQRGIVPLRSESDFSNGYLDTPLDWMPGTKNMRLKHVTAVVRTTDPNSIYLKFLRDEMEGSHRATAIVLNTFADLEGDVLDAMSAVLPAPIYPVGPLTMFRGQALDTGGSSLREKDSTCLEWLDGKAAGSVLYVNFGSLEVMTNEKLAEFAWGMADSGYDFLWVIRNDVAMGRPAVLPREFYAGTSGRGMLAGWCPQEEVLAHPSVGGFLTHCGWNSVVESIGAGVPMLCWPLGAEQHANCLYACAEWGIGMEVERDAKREGVAALVRELMGGARGKEMRARALQWKERATRTTRRGGKSFEMLERLIKEVLHR
ncbi:7-deoxyloganetin glucosyltransferase-like [Iris pallida]|uniref:Glycosyltransferase n=1 Tax=Iris pallida TaxID=29817 RepID=A0AAX6DJ04_IRIPA|nr:7-deoxyloganetin glucosyltransferase-like [Iris pallida]